MTWEPEASLDVLRLRANLLARIRSVFEARGVLEVETPILGHRSVTDPYIESFRSGDLYLQTSPEFAMKRLLAAGSGPIFQISKAFRAGESGSRHNPEFTMIEWYRPGYDHHALMDELDLLLQEILESETAEREAYGALFQRHVGLDPHIADRDALERVATAAGEAPSAASELEVDDWLNLLMARVIEPRLGRERPFFVYDYPVCLKALARLRAETPPVAERFELYYRGMELANGYHELTDAREQRARFADDRKRREVLDLAAVDEDERLVDALEAGLPQSAGVALGFDRLVMIAAGATSIRDVLSFPFEIS